jgi:hypothetical protein
LLAPTATRILSTKVAATMAHPPAMGSPPRAATVVEASESVVAANVLAQGVLVFMTVSRLIFRPSSVPTPLARAQGSACLR